LSELRLGQFATGKQAERLQVRAIRQTS
jgi:hypothetical protein